MVTDVSLLQTLWKVIGMVGGTQKHVLAAESYSTWTDGWREVKRIQKWL